MNFCNKKMKKAELILVPSPGKGHLIPALEFAKRLVNQDDRISITVVSINLPFDSFIDAHIESVKASEPHRIKFLDVPQQPQHPSVVEDLQSLKGHVYALNNIQTPILKEVLANILSSKSIADSTEFTGVVFDFVFAPLVDIAHQFNVPSYIFITSNGGYLSLMFHLIARHSQTQNSSEFKQSDPDELIPGFINPVPPRVLPLALFDEDNGYPSYMMNAQKFKTVTGIMVNTFEELEPYAINGFSNGGNPPVYPVGPVLDIGCKPHPELDFVQREKVMKWLDEQPRSSVVFLCFGSFGCFGASQVKEIALGLEQSGYRFLWSLRMPRQQPGHHDENMLPEGFVERIQGKGMICRWAPQVEILAHQAIGGFVSHCGWNSVLESLWFGVPMVTWPMYCEQQLNAFKMVRELGLAVELRLDYRDTNGDVVTSDEIEKAVMQVMDESNEIRKKVKDMAEIASKAIAKGGSSFLSIQRLIQDMIGNN